MQGVFRRRSWLLVLMAVVYFASWVALMCGVLMLAYRIAGV